MSSLHLQCELTKAAGKFKERTNGNKSYVRCIAIFFMCGKLHIQNKKKKVNCVYCIPVYMLRIQVGFISLSWCCRLFLIFLRVIRKDCSVDLQWAAVHMNGDRPGTTNIAFQVSTYWWYYWFPTISFQVSTYWGYYDFPTISLLPNYWWYYDWYLWYYDGSSITFQVSTYWW